MEQIQNISQQTRSIWMSLCSGYPLLLLAGFVSLHILNAFVLSYFFRLLPDGGHVIMLRGCGCLLVAIFYARLKGLSLKPKVPKVQLLRLFVGGAAISLSVLSYKWIDAGSAMIFARYDVIFLAIVAEARSKRNILAFVVCGFAVLTPFLIYHQAPVDGVNFLTGSLLGVGGGFMMAVSYYLLSSSGRVENISVTTLVPGVASLMYGLFLSLQNKVIFEWQPSYFIYAIVSGSIMYLMYYLTIEMYKRVGVAKGEYPTVFAALLSIPLSALIFDVQYSVIYLSIMLALSSVLVWIIHNQERLKREH